MSYKEFCEHLAKLLNSGYITYSVYADMTKKTNKTPAEYQYLYNSIRRGC